MINENFQKRSMTCSAAATRSSNSGRATSWNAEWRSPRNRPAKASRISVFCPAVKKALDGNCTFVCDASISILRQSVSLDEIDALPRRRERDSVFRIPANPFQGAAVHRYYPARKPSMAICDTALRHCNAGKGVSDIVSVEL